MLTLALLVGEAASVADAGWIVKILEQSPIAGAIIFVMWMMMGKMDKLMDKHSAQIAAMAQSCHDHQEKIVTQCTKSIDGVTEVIRTNSEALGRNDAKLDRADARTARAAE